jgi:hypothetical protein
MFKSSCVMSSRLRVRVGFVIAHKAGRFVLGVGERTIKQFAIWIKIPRSTSPIGDSA